jgi:uncharacterized membrane protein
MIRDLITQLVKKTAILCAVVVNVAFFTAPLYMAPVSAANASVDTACQGLALADPGSDCDPGKATNTIGTLARNIINILSVIVGAVSVIMIIIGGFRYVLSNGDSNGVSGAKNTILYAVVGLVIVLFAQVIVRFVLTKIK